MDAKEMKKILAGVGIAGLLSGLPMGSGVAFGGSGWGAKGDSAVGTEKTEAAGAGSGWGGNKGSAVSTQEEIEKAKEKAKGAVQDDKKGTVAPEEEEKKAPAGSSGWGGTK